MIRIAELEFDEYNEMELASHRITPNEVMQMLRNRLQCVAIDETDLEIAS